MADLSDKLADDVRREILRDMAPGFWTVCFKSGLAVLMGGLASLLICGQFGIGITHAALHFNSQLHSHVQDLGSALGCGALFALIPPFVLRILCSPLQFRVIVRKKFHASFLWLVGLGAVLAHHGETAVELLGFTLWAGAAALTFGGISRLIDRLTWKPALQGNR